MHLLDSVARYMHKKALLLTINQEGNILFYFGY